MFFEKKHPFIKAVMDLLPESYNPQYWGSVGPALLNNVARSGRVDNTTYTILDPPFFYPVYWSSFRLVLRPEDKRMVFNHVQSLLRCAFMA